MCSVILPYVQRILQWIYVDLEDLEERGTGSVQDIENKEPYKRPHVIVM